MPVHVRSGGRGSRCAHVAAKAADTRTGVEAETAHDQVKTCTGCVHESDTVSYSPYLYSQAEVELRAARESEATTRAAAKARSAAEAADALAGGEVETARQRAWDDWKDDNPRGAGNSMLRPTA